jgi:hypothetical protein
MSSNVLESVVIKDLDLLYEDSSTGIDHKLIEKAFLR